MELKVVWGARLKPSCVIALVLGVLFAVGCANEIEDELSIGCPIGTDHTSPESFALGLAVAWSNKNLAAIDALLASDFEFVILDQDVEDLPWVSNGRWDRVQEMTIARNMMDVSYSGDELPVDSIEMTFNVISSKTSEGAFDTIADAQITILVGPDEGWVSDTRFALALRADADGLLRLTEMQEIRPVARSSVVPSVVNSSFGAVKSLYR